MNCMIYRFFSVIGYKILNSMCYTVNPYLFDIYSSVSINPILLTAALILNCA